jgi:hypothetical protein
MGPSDEPDESDADEGHGDRHARQRDRQGDHALTAVTGTTIASDQSATLPSLISSAAFCAFSLLA